MIKLQIETEDIKKLMNNIEAGYKKRDLLEIEFYHGIMAGFDIVRRFIGAMEDKQDREQSNQYKEG